MGSTINISTDDGHNLSAYRAAPDADAKGGLVVVQEIFGVNSHIREVCDNYAKLGYVALAPAYFDRLERGVELGYDDAGMEKGMDLAPDLEAEQIRLDTKAAIAALAETGPVFIVGYCFGGGVAWDAACHLKGLNAAVGYYGRRIIDEYKNQAPQCPTMLHFGDEDFLIPNDRVEAISQAHPDVELFVYPGAGHGFSCNPREDYREDAAKLALERTLEFFDKHR